ncbi:MAG: prephenate dehydrogenase/arogenate dehydrogenase family protein [Thermodesulfobacteriota bacterium]|nr:prephenate dehydrogenase/arogenate dehydrogenase family protein [Thermodesulfobacteriota bacterium]
MEFKKIAIIGVGLIGGSFARSLKKYALCKEIIGYGRSEKNLKKALNLGVIDDYRREFSEDMKDFDLILLATPVSTIVTITKNIIPFLKPGTIVFDAGSVKGKIVKDVESFLPAHITFIGGHPIAGRENSGVEAAQDDLFFGHKMVFTPTSITSKEKLKKLMDLWAKIGCEIIIMDKDYHDEIFSQISHLPHVIAYCLVNSIFEYFGKHDVITNFSAGGFKDYTRIAQSHPEMWKDILLMNKKNILNAIDSFLHYLLMLKGFLSEDDEEKLLREFIKSREIKRKLK